LFVLVETASARTSLGPDTPVAAAAEELVCEELPHAASTAVAVSREPAASARHTAPRRLRPE
jgi:hypothetical protein